MTAGEDASAWAHGLEAVIGRIAPRFGRKKPRRRAGVSHGLAGAGGARTVGSWRKRRAIARPTGRRTVEPCGSTPPASIAPTEVSILPDIQFQCVSA